MLCIKIFTKFNFSEYSENSNFYDAKIIAKMKDETKDIPTAEFVVLKMANKNKDVKNESNLIYGHTL